MNAVATRPRVAKAKPTPATSPVADILARIDTVEVRLAMALDAADEGSDLAVLIFGIIDTLLPLAVPPLYRAPVSKTDVDETYRELLFPLSALKAVLMMSEGLVMEATLQQAFEILDRAHSDMDSALVQHWPIPEHPPGQNGSVGNAADFERGTVPTDLESAASQVQDKTSTPNEALGIELAAANTTTVMRVAAHDANSDAVWGVFKLNELANEAADAALREADAAPDVDGLWAASSLYAQAIKLCGLVCANADNELVYAGLMLMEITKERVDTLAQAEMDKEAQS